MSLTASNSSRLTRSRSRNQRSAWLRNSVSTSRRTPCATPAASFISRAISSKNRLLVWVMCGLRSAGHRGSKTMAIAASGRKRTDDGGRRTGKGTDYLRSNSHLRANERDAVLFCPSSVLCRPSSMLYVIPFPAFDPVLVRFRPLAIRWYALAYIVGILAGWLYARRVIRTEKHWGGPAPMTVEDFDDFVLWVTLGIILGGRIGYVLFYNPSYFAAYPAEIVQLWKGGMSFHGGFLGCVLAVVLFARHRGLSFLPLGDVTCAAGPIGLFLGRIANFINGELWGRPADVPLAIA